jgi:hypothetical protein
MVRFFVIFVVCLVVLFRIDMLDSVQQRVADPWTQWLATASAHLISVFDTDVLHQGRILMSKATGFAVSIEGSSSFRVEKAPTIPFCAALSRSEER